MCWKGKKICSVCVDVCVGVHRDGWTDVPIWCGSQAKIDEEKSGVWRRDAQQGPLLLFRGVSELDELHDLRRVFL